MAELMPGVPSLPGDESTWQAFVDQFETLKRGDVPLSLTNWGNSTARPALANGAAIEIGGATYRFTDEAVIQNDPGLSAGTIYVIIQTNDPNPESATPYFTNVVPVWSQDLFGWYDASGVSRYTGHLMEWDGASAYTDKRVIKGDSGGLQVAGNAFIGGNITAAEAVIGDTGQFTSPPVLRSEMVSTTVHHILEIGHHTFSEQLRDEVGIMRLEAQVDGAWRTVTLIGDGDNISIYSDGVNFRVSDASSSSLGALGWIFKG